MKKKNLVCVSALCALMSFSFVSCDDDNEPSLNIPNVSVTNVSFTDENPEALKVSGTLNWTAPSSVDNVTKYVIYGSSDGTANIKNPRRYTKQSPYSGNWMYGVSS